MQCRQTNTKDEEISFCTKLSHKLNEKNEWTNGGDLSLSAQLLLCSQPLFLAYGKALFKDPAGVATRNKRGFRKPFSVASRKD